MAPGSGPGVDATLAIWPNLRWPLPREHGPRLVAQEGKLALHDDGADFTDTWHQPQPMRCRPVADARGLFQVQGEYGPQSDWGWRTGLSLRTPTGELVLQMTNIAPWGEEVRAVRMICRRHP